MKNKYTPTGNKQIYLNCSVWCSYTYWDFRFQRSGSKVPKKKIYIYIYIFKNKEFYGSEEQKKQRDIRALHRKAKSSPLRFQYETGCKRMSSIPQDWAK